MNRKNYLKRIDIAVAILVLVILGYLFISFVNEQAQEYQERRDRRRELVRECVDQGGDPVITFSQSGRLTGYYGCRGVD